MKLSHSILLFVSIGVIFMFDLLTPLGYIEWMLYVIPIILTLNDKKPKVPYVTATAVTILITLGAIFSPPGGIALPIALANRVLGITLVWVIAVVVGQKICADILSKQSERHYESLYNSIRDAFVVVDMTGRIQEFNDTYAQMLGYSHQELRQLTYVDLTPEKWHAYEAHIVEKQILPHGHSDVYEKEYRKKDGTVFPVELRTFLIKDDEGNPSAMCAIVHDSSERKLAEAEHARLWKVLESSLNEIYIFDADTLRFEFANHGARQNIGYTLKQLQSLTPVDIKPQFTEYSFREMIRPLVQGEKNKLVFETIHRRSDSSSYPVEVHLQFLRQFDKQIFLAVINDITERKRVEEELRNTRDKLEATLTAMPDLLFEVDRSSRIFDYRALRTELLAAPPEQFLGKTFGEILPPEAAAICMEAVHTAAAKGVGLSKPYRLELHHGEHWFELSVARKGTASNGDSRFISLARDITERIKAEQTLRDREERFRSIIEATPNALIIADGSGVISLVNQHTEHMFGYTRQELLGKTMDFLLPERFRANHNVYIKNYFTSPEARPMGTGRELVALRKDGSEHPVEIALTPMKTDEGVFVLISIVDITARKRAEQALRDSEITLKRAQTVAHMGSWRLDVRQNILEWSRETYNIFGVPEGVSLTYESFLSGIHPDDRAHVDASWNAALKGAPYDIEHRIIVNGNIKWVRERAELEIDPSGTLVRGIGTVQDITELKYAEQKIKSALEEKEVLLKEIHHRVKNNMQIISSLLDVQSDQVSDGEFKGAFREIQNRVKSMALIHELLFQSADIGKINFADYARVLVESVRSSFDTTARHIVVTTDIVSLLMDIEAALPCGLIISELMSNAFKHAFLGKNEGTIFVGVSERAGSNIMLTVHDNGIGIAAGIDFAKTRSLGLSIVQTLAKQLGGTFTLENNNGTEATILFPALNSTKDRKL